MSESGTSKTIAAFISVIMPSLTAAPSTEGSTSTPEDSQIDTATIIYTVAGAIWILAAGSYMTFLMAIMDERSDNTEETGVMVAPRTRFTAHILWAVLKGLLWPLVLLWILVASTVMECYIPVCKWCAGGCMCDVSKCREAYERLSREPGDKRGVAGVGSQTAWSAGIVRNQPSNIGPMEMPPTYKAATMPMELSKLRKGN